MAESNSMIILASIGAVLMMTSLFVTLLVLRQRRKLKNSKYDIPKQLINTKELSLISKSPGIPIQLESRTAQTSIRKSLENNYNRKANNFKDLIEHRRGEVDPLLGVFHQSTLKKAYSEANLMEARGSGLPKLLLTLVWTPLDQSLNISISNLENFPKRFASSSLCLQLTLSIPTRKSNNSQKTQKQLQMDHHAVPYRFDKITFEEVGKSKLTVELKGKKPGLFKEFVIGESSLHMQELNILPNKLFTRTLHLETKEQVTADPVQSNVFGTAGQLLIGLKCRWNCEEFLKIQIHVKKAAKMNIFLPGKEFKVEVLVRMGEEILASFSTKLSPGPSPEWDSQFTCNLSQSQFEESVIDMTLIRIAPVKGITKIGRASLSLSTDRNGCSHWQEALRCMGTQVQQWHSVLLLQNFVGYIEKEKAACIGKLLIGLQFIDTRESCKMKIVIKKLADFGFHKGGGEYKVKVIAHNLQERLRTFATKAIPLGDLVWNESFVLNLDPLSLRNYKLNVDLIRIGRLKGSSKIGNLTLGSAESPSGEDHWEECLMNSLMEIDRWHSLYPTT